jgi:hypothetical protein
MELFNSTRLFTCIDLDMHLPQIERNLQMKMNEVRTMAKSLGLNSFGKTKAVLIREIQRKEGNFDCYGTALNYCDQLDCLFHDSCLSEKEQLKEKIT